MKIFKMYGANFCTENIKKVGIAYAFPTLPAILIVSKLSWTAVFLGERAEFQLLSYKHQQHTYSHRNQNIIQRVALRFPTQQK